MFRFRKQLTKIKIEQNKQEINRLKLRVDELYKIVEKLV